MGLLGFCFLTFILIASCNLCIGHARSTFDVLKYGAKGDGHSDDTQAFVNAWNDLCAANSDTATLVVPAGYNFLLRVARFKGPCKSKKVHIQILGNILAPERNEWGNLCSGLWLHLMDIKDMKVDGSGTIDGRGHAWWGNLTDQGCTALPTALLFERCDGLQIKGLTHINGPKFHIHVVHSKDVTIKNVKIHSPLESHNTDGIDITNSVGVSIHDAVIGTGDDCIAIKGGTRFLNISNVICGPGHGISVGSLGEGGQEEKVENVHVWNCTFNGATSAVKVKTWPGGKGYAKNIIFEHITVNQTDYPVFIDQHYMRKPEQPDAVKVSDVTFNDVHGTCTSEHAVVLDCAHIWCNNITLNQINITSIVPKKPANATCNFVQGKATNITSPLVPCIKAK